MGWVTSRSFNTECYSKTYIHTQPALRLITMLVWTISFSNTEFSDLSTPKILIQYSKYFKIIQTI